MTGWWIAAALTALNLALAWYSGRQRRRTEELYQDPVLSILSAHGRHSQRELYLQKAIDLAWDAAHEFADDPQLALEAVCAHLEQLVTPLPPDLERALSDPSIVVDRDNEVRLADGRTLAEHMAQWREFPKQRVRPCGSGPCMFEPAAGGACPWCGWERPE